MKSWGHVRARWKIIPVAIAVAVIPLALAPAGAATKSAVPVPPNGCDSSFDPYVYSQAVVSACGYATFPLQAVIALDGGGSSYSYAVNGTTVRFYAPPVGFDPATATDAQLDEYAFPPRPTDPTALSVWQNEMENWKGTTPPGPFLAESNTQLSSSTTYNWSGYVVGGGYTYTHAEGWYTEPTIYSSVCPTTAEATWAGIGGYNGNKYLGQDGTAHNLAGVGDHQAWWEVVPANYAMPVPGLTAHPGHLFDASTRHITDGYRFWLYDYYDGTTKNFDETGGSLSDYSGQTAEVIMERPKNNGTLQYLSNFGTFQVLYSKANDSWIGGYSPSVSRIGLAMDAEVTGDLLAQESDIDADGGFSVQQENCQ